MTGHRFALSLITLTAAAACVGGTDIPATIVWETELRPDIAHPDVGGQAAAVADPSGTQVSVLLTGAEPGATHVWGLLTGNCADPGTQVGPSIDYPVLVPDAAGSAEANTHLGPRLSSDESYFIEIRMSATDDSRVACGDLTPR
jgi:hypothetical protein